MVQPMSFEQVRELEAKLIARAGSDAEFKAALLADPNAAAAEFLQGEGVELPDDISFSVIENTASSYTIALPPNSADMELSDAELDAIAGGMYYYPPKGG